MAKYRVFYSKVNSCNGSFVKLENNLNNLQSMMDELDELEIYKMCTKKYDFIKEKYDSIISDYKNVFMSKISGN